MLCVRKPTDCEPRRKEEYEPQMTQMNADKDRNQRAVKLFPICAHLRNLR